MKLLGALAIIVPLHFVQAADLLSCQTSNTNHFQRRLRIFETNSGLNFEATSFCAPDSGICSSYLKQGPIHQNVVYVAGHKFLSSNFSGDEIQMFHIFGAYILNDEIMGIKIEFPDDGCRLNIGGSDEA
jgi:hypothetical protein